MLARLTIALLLVAQSLFGWICARSDDVSQSCYLVLRSSCTTAVHAEAAGDCCEATLGGGAPPSCCATEHHERSEPAAPKTPCTPERCPECRLLPPPARSLPVRDSALDELRPLWSAPPSDPEYASLIRTPEAARAPLSSQVEGARPPPQRAAMCIWTI